MSRALSSAIARRTSSSGGGGLSTSSSSSPSVASKTRYLSSAPPPPPPSPSPPSGRHFMPQSEPSQLGEKGNMVPVNKLSISDAIALITIRLGRLESFMHEQEAKDAGIHPSSATSSAVGGKTTKAMDEDQMVMMSSLLNRMELVEKQLASLGSGGVATQPPPVDMEEFRNELTAVKSHVDEMSGKITETTNNVMKLQSIVLDKLLVVS